MSENANPKCPQCGAEMPGGAAGRVCPRCAAAFLKGEPTKIPGGTAGSPRPFTPPPVAELAPLFPQLEILELIGQGGMGAVYKARQKELDRIVALKILPPGVGGADFAERFAREAKALARLNHPGIVTLYEFGRSNGLFFFLMEYVDGATLRQVLQGGRISPREALAIVPAICDALQYAHDQGIVHRDIKPENILLDRRGRTKVADFGLAKLMESGGEVSDIDSGTPASGSAATQASKVMGTPQYMAPEQVEHPATVDHRADIYALGVVFYQMLTGEMPGKRVEAPSTKVQIDVRLDEVVLRALEKNPDRRYGQASQIKTAVETIVGTEARPEQLAAAIGEPGQRTTRILALERNVVLPVRLLLIIALGYYAFFAGWFSVPGVTGAADWVLHNATLLKSWFLEYALASLVLGAILIWGKSLTMTKIGTVVFVGGLLDCILMATLTFVCEPGGFDTKLYPFFAVLILHNALAIPSAFPQLLLNFLTIGSFIAGGVLDTALNPRPPFMDVESILHENPVERVAVLVIWALCCWAVQMLFDKRKRVEAELGGSGRATPSASRQPTPTNAPGSGWKMVGGLAVVTVALGLGWAYRASKARWAESEAIKNRQLPRIEATSARKGDMGRRIGALGTVESSNSVVFAIDEKYCQEVIRKFDAHRTMAVEATTTDGASFGHGFLAGVENRIDASTGTLKCKATLFPEEGNLMVPGLFLNLSMLLEMEHGVTLVPTADVQRDPQSAFVWVIQADGRVTRRPVRMGTMDGDWTEIQSGLAPGEVIASSGFDNLSEGQKVQKNLLVAKPASIQVPSHSVEWLKIQPLDGWIADLQNSDEKVRKMAEMAMTEMGTNTLPEILKTLSETNESPADDTRRFNTAQALKFMGSGARSGLPAFTALLESGRFPAGYSGARALAFSAPAVPEAFSILTNGLKDASAGVRVAASHGVGLCFNTETNNYAEPALPLLLSNLTDKDKDVRLATANALMLYAQHQSFHFPPLDAKADLLIPPLIELLHDKYSYVRETATYTLTDACLRDGLKPWIPAIQKLLGDPDEGVRQSATNLLQRLNVTMATNTSLNASQMPILSVQATGTNPLSYQWYFIPTNGANMTNAPQK